MKDWMEKRNDMVSKVGIVFGSETNGLSTEEENLCDVMSTIPMAQDYPSINLSHSVMIYAYELAQIRHLEKRGF